METLENSLSADKLYSAQTIAIKIGSALLVDANTGQLRNDWLQTLAEDVAWLHEQGKNIILVSSGAIALGRNMLGYDQKILSLEQSQAAASVGQIALAQAYREALATYDIVTAQILLTLEDTRDRKRYLNGTATLKALKKAKAIPVVNENDSVATDEIRYGDNDRLAARVASMAQADILILLSDIDGLYSADPRKDKTASHIPVVETITPEIESMAGSIGSSLAKGGMKTKIQAAQIAVQGGCAMTITEGSRANPIKALCNHARSTWFMAKDNAKAARKQWIAGMRSEGILIIDAGAEEALKQGKSLLCAGITAVEGDFERGDPVAIQTTRQETLGMALASYPSKEAEIIKGHKSDQIYSLLGYMGRSVMVHRDDLSLWK